MGWIAGALFAIAIAIFLGATTVAGILDDIRSEVSHIVAEMADRNRRE
jgi:hypothetical protein